MVVSMYHFMKRRRGTKTTSAPNESDEKTVGRQTIQGYTDIQRLNQLINAKRSKVVLESSMKENLQCLRAENATLIEIVARIIGRLDELESKPD